MSPSQILISNSVDKFLGMGRGVKGWLTWYGLREWATQLDFQGSAPEISLICIHRAECGPAPFRRSGDGKGNLGRKEHLLGLDHLDGDCDAVEHDAFHGCGKCVKIHTQVILWSALVLSSGQNQSCVLQQASHIDNAAAVYVFFCPHGLQKIYFNFHLFFVRLPMRLAMLSISILPFSSVEWASEFVLSSMPISSHLIFHIALWGWNYHHAHFTDEQAEAWGSKWLGQEVIVYQWERWDLHPALFNSFRRPGYQIWVWSKDIKEHINHLAKGPRTWFKEPGSWSMLFFLIETTKESFLSQN